jgi:DNA (cytosine-5)-methyltransferase 1
MSDLPKWVRSKRKRFPKPNNLTFAGLFSGCGGLDLGGILAGLRPIYAADHDGVAVDTYRKNIGDHACCVDLAESDISPKFTGVDLLLGGPPCQGFSSAGPKNAQDPRNKLWQHYLEYVRVWRPKVFLMENVPGFRTEFPMFAKEAERVLGGRYKLFWRRFITQYYGVPQFRDRMIIQGVRKDVARGPAWPAPTSPEIWSYTENFPTSISMAKALADLGPADSSLASHSDHFSVPLGDADENVAKHIPNAGSLKDIPDMHLPAPYSGRTRAPRGWQWYYRKPRPALPARGVIASIRPIYATILAPDVYVRGKAGSWRWEAVDRDTHTDKKGYYTSPVPQRRLTLRECARLQTFPDWFRFEGTPLQVHRQIGNAVPVEFARRLCEAVSRLIEHGDEVATIPNQAELFEV